MAKDKVVTEEKFEEVEEGLDVIEIPVLKHCNNQLPEYQNTYDVGCDGRANLPDGVEVTISPGNRALIPLGISTAIPPGYFIMLAPRSGLANKFGITLANSIGIVDPGFRNQYGAILVNLGNKAFVVRNGDRICQLVLMKYAQMSLNEVDILPELDERGLGGFGSTGTE